MNKGHTPPSWNKETKNIYLLRLIMQYTVYISTSTGAAVGEGQVGGSAPHGTMDPVELVLGERVHLGLSVTDHGEII